MSGLELFLKENKIMPKKVLFAASQSFVDEEGKPLLWEIRSLSAAEDEVLRISSMKRENGALELDVAKYAGALAAKATVFPNLKDVSLQDSYGVMGEDKLLKAMLSPGEYQNYLKEVRKLNGFNVVTKDMVDSAKN